MIPQKSEVSLAKPICKKSNLLYLQKKCFSKMSSKRSKEFYFPPFLKVGTRFNDLEGTRDFWLLNPNVVKPNF